MDQSQSHKQKLLAKLNSLVPSYNKGTPQTVDQRQQTAQPPAKPSKFIRGSIEKKITFLQKKQIMLQQRKILDSLPSYNIEEVEIKLSDPEYVNKISTIDISKDESQSFDSEYMGPSSKNRICLQCGLDNVSCPYHMGRLKLPKNIIHPWFEDVVFKIMTCVCFQCGTPLATMRQLEEKGITKLKGKKRLWAISKLCENLSCTNIDACKASPKEYKYDYNINKIEYSTNRKNKRTKAVVSAIPSGNLLTIDEFRERLKSISEETLKMLGFRQGVRPENFITDVWPVCPPPTRPSEIINASENTSDLTELYNNMNKRVKDINEGKEEGKSGKNAWARLLNFIHALIDNTKKKVKRNHAHEYVSIRQRIEKKEGLVRGALMGKRGNFCGRSVACPGPDLEIDQVGVPQQFAGILTVKMEVTTRNVEYLRDLNKQGKITTIYKGSGASRGHYIDREYNESTFIAVGDVIQRFLENDDVLMMNRQPTLHRNSMLGFRVVLIPGLIFRMNLSCTTGLNLDFDGDEVNAHLPQTQEGTAELYGIVNIKDNIISGEYNGPIVALVQDALTGAWLMTQDDVILDDSTFYDCALAAGLMHRIEEVQAKAIELGVNPFSGRVLFSLTLPGDLYYHANKAKDGQGEVLIYRGILIKGGIYKAVAGTVSNSIVHVIHKDFGKEDACDFLSKAQFIINRYLYYRGFTVDIEDSDEALTPESRDKLQTILDDVVEKVRPYSVVEEDPLKEIQRERRINDVLNDALNIGAKEISKIPWENNYKVMALSQAKGKVMNLTQIMTFLGQQNVEGRRMPKILNKGKRTLPYFDHDDPDPASQGFVFEGFFYGLGPVAFFFHASGGRDGLIDTSLRTSDTGYQHRKFLKAVEDVKVGHNGAVSMSNGDILQMVYGHTGLDTRKLIRNRDDILTFFNISHLVGKTNAKYGYVPK
jgi:DNA-directed RNA polymerase beta' subunit